MKRYKHSLSHYKLTSGNMGYLYPTTWFPVIPGDTVQMSTSVLTRVNPPKYPVMHPLRARVVQVFCPMRLLWEDFEEFRTGFDKDGAASTKVHPTISLVNPAANSLADYLGIPPGTYTVAVNALPFRMYELVYRELMRDQQLQASAAIDFSDGADVTTNKATVRQVNWERDYFTVARTSEQMGSEVTLPLGTSATVKTQASPGFTGVQEELKLLNANSTALDGGKAFRSSTTGLFEGTNADATGTQGVYPSNLYADLSAATAASINDLREAFALQRFAEARNRYGARYVEFLRYLGVKSSDGRLDRPEILGSGQSTIQFSEVLQTGVTTDATAKTGVGIMSGHSREFW